MQASGLNSVTQTLRSNSCSVFSATTLKSVSGWLRLVRSKVYPVKYGLREKSDTLWEKWTSLLLFQQASTFMPSQRLFVRKGCLAGRARIRLNLKMLTKHVPFTIRFVPEVLPTNFTGKTLSWQRMKSISRRVNFNNRASNSTPSLRKRHCRWKLEGVMAVNFSWAQF